MQVQLLHWKTSVIPGVGSDPQAVINEAIGDDYDIYVGIMWSRIGSPTPRAESGSVEEFERALDRWRRDRSSIRIMFYFGTRDIPIGDVDPDQLRALREFKARLGAENGTLYDEYSSLDDFETKVQYHLGGLVREFAAGVWGQAAATRGAPPPNPEPALLPMLDEEDAPEGILDVVARGYQAFMQMNDHMHRMTSAVGDLNSGLTEQTEQMAEVGRSDDPNAIKRWTLIASKTAQDLELFVSRIRVELPGFSESMLSAVDATMASTSLVTEFGGAEETKVREQISLMENLKTSTAGTIAKTLVFRGNLAKWPPVSRALNRSRAKALQVLDELLKAFQNGVSLMDTAIKQMEGLLPV
ncbi:MAG: hypothetical protein NTX23_05345 [Candidatus Bipolaricaulota bacterium]|nr:hypothetical protein [Candidatus Bipolaricaulota bacterium]